MGFLQDTTNNPRTYWMQFLFNGQMHRLSHTYTINPAATVYMEGIVPAGKLIHIFSRNMSVAAGGPITVDLIEAPTITDGTTPPTVVSNLDRRSAKTPALINYVDPTAVSGGTLIDRDYVATTGGPNSATSISAGATERILKPSTKYVITMTNTGAQASTFNIGIVWYESGN